MKNIREMARTYQNIKNDLLQECNFVFINLVRAGCWHDDYTDCEPERAKECTLNRCRFHSFTIGENHLTLTLKERMCGEEYDDTYFIKIPYESFDDIASFILNRLDEQKKYVEEFEKEEIQRQKEIEENTKAQEHIQYLRLKEKFEGSKK